MSKYIVLYLDAAKVEIGRLTPAVQAKIKTAEEAIASGNIQSLYIKSLKGPINELVLGNYRLIFFYWKGRCILFVEIFRKKSTKTPSRIIRHAEDLYKKLK